MVLGCEAGVCEVAIDVAPFFETSIIEHLQFVCDDKGDDAVCETFLEHQETYILHLSIYRQVFEPILAAKIVIFADIGKFVGDFFKLGEHTVVHNNRNYCWI